ncbi:hypothetical protein Poli38472_004402 [Pythium oligandrum]|uniref:F-box domain-containing protein n=1 Tax=Pythium oligandrum TaxID=41045 RepID=A0A8K1CAW7_PYTOL|nr:hypothetical protein Poli38472_004402 [Pythium oligandrum]|eukprot:TMW59333.1 hypothetical protein Poli38472_004402 [Pythium oligandrum]
MMMSQLPEELVHRCAEFLVGPDVFSFSHVNHRLYEQLSGADVWAPRVTVSLNRLKLSAEQPDLRYKRMYGLARSFLSKPFDPSFGGRGCSSSFPAIAHRVDSLDTWVCFRPEFLDKSVNMFDTIDVHCSVDNILTVPIQLGRWYHFAWIYDLETETVFFNGQQIAQTPRNERTVHCFWGCELRTNFFGVPRDVSSGADLVVHGFIDAFRNWSGRLSADEIQRLAKCQLLERGPNDDVKGTKARFLSRKWVFCSRPVEKLAIRRHEQSSEERNQA